MKSVFGIIDAADPPGREIVWPAPVDSTVTGFSEIVSTNELAVRFTARSSQEAADSLFASDDWTIGVIGKIFHRDVPRQTELLARLLAELRTGCSDLLRESFGEYVLVVINRSQGEVFLYSDVLSIRPVFIYPGPDRIVFGTDAWQMVKEGLVPATLDLDAFSSWLLLDHVIGNDTIIQGLKRLPPANCARLSRSGLNQKPYKDFRINSRQVPEEELLERIESAVTDSCRSVVTREKELNCFLSGGFDSRYLLCVLNELGADLYAHTVQYDSAEEDAARAVVDALNVEGSFVDVPASVLDLHEGSPFYFAPWGFPAWKFVTEIPVRKFGLQSTLVDGLMGDELIRGFDYEEGVRDAIRQFGIGEGMLRNYEFVGPFIFTPSLAGRIRGRVRDKIEEYFRGVDGDSEKAAFQWLLFNRKSTCHTTNHIYNQSRVETVHPFVCTDLIDLRLESDNRPFNARLYETLFSRRYPAVAHVPHSNNLQPRYSGIGSFSWEIWKRLPSALAPLIDSGTSGVFRRNFAASRLAGYAFGHAQQFYVARQLLMIAMLLRRLQEKGMSIPWNEI
ncbi:asparagine synthase-related protein [Lentisalinibacter orientalis]|uniref:asparagine synthase-related protein n=1 Tax=Lentisalinibacter orientalis TaxID=2992241 RepID=UPI00386FA5E4